MIRVSASAFDILWTDLGHDRPPEPLSVRSVGGTEEERAEVRKAVYDNLAERGLYDGSALEPALTERLALLASAEVFVACEAMVDMTAEAPFRAVTAVRGRRGVLATQPEQTIALAAIRDAELCTAIIDVLPELTAGPGYGVSLPASSLAGSVEDPVFSSRGAASAASSAQLREVLAIQARPVYSAGSFSVSRRGPSGRVARVGGLSWFDTDVGAYCATKTPGRGGQDWVNVTPVDSTRLAARVASLLTPED
ncbi:MULTISPECIES: ESX secretion-associated protein EspG [unclassified Amycolatopsis]|uniref:ESX secretion-associated protein EspG n=1 Tax=unclassified Amycolatopsis TaxID=2618356 RepID=UPI001FF331F8|nr:ESX secretion-associated protein EspG [Amycolatopsis sp. FBCC-B4732]UOX89962.1 ESX secretion-associated protein EspG [Amycolatopsis sp. FBCC-B4732]